MTITLYHGSNQRFDQFEINESLLRTNKEHLAEGLGIYLTENRSFAATYGEYLYEVEVDEAAITDFTDENEIRLLLETLSAICGIPLLDWINTERFIQSVQSGNIAVANLHDEIILLLDNNEGFHATYSHLITEEEDCLFEEIKTAFLATIQDVLRYYDAGFKEIIYICIKHPENLRIKNR